MSQDLLWVTDPARRTCLATVTAVRGGLFQVDRALFAPRSTACRHPQNHDKGTVWMRGEKRRLRVVRSLSDGVWYGLRGVVPSVGDDLQCELDQETRDQASRAHTAMHVAMAHFAAAGAPPLVVDPEVRGGGHFRLTFAWSPAAVLKQTWGQVEQTLAADLVVNRSQAVGGEAYGVTRQQFQPDDPFPGPEVVSLVEILGVCTYPCDGSHVDRTGRIAGIRLVHAAQGKDGYVLTAKVW